MRSTVQINLTACLLTLSINCVCLAFNPYKNDAQVPYSWDVSARGVTWAIKGNAPEIVSESMNSAANSWSLATGGVLSMSAGAKQITVIWDTTGNKLPDPLYLAYTFLKTKGTRILGATLVINAKNYTFHRGAPHGVGAAVNGLRDADIDGVIVHELGHALGLDHSDTSPSTIVSFDPNDPPTMNSTLHPGTEALHADDKAGIRSLYGATPAASSAAPSGTGYAGLPSPSAISASVTHGKAPVTTTFIQSTANENSLWDFGDGSTATGAAPTHTFVKAGSYTVTVTNGAQVSTIMIQACKKTPKVH